MKEIKIYLFIFVLFVVVIQGTLVFTILFTIQLFDEIDNDNLVFLDLVDQLCAL